MRRAVAIAASLSVVIATTAAAGCVTPSERLERAALSWNPAAAAKPGNAARYAWVRRNRATGAIEAIGAATFRALSAEGGRVVVRLAYDASPFKDASSHADEVVIDARAPRLTALDAVRIFRDGAREPDGFAADIDRSEVEVEASVHDDEARAAGKVFRCERLDVVVKKVGWIDTARDAFAIWISREGPPPLGIVRIDFVQAYDPADAGRAERRQGSLRLDAGGE